MANPRGLASRERITARVPLHVAEILERAAMMVGSTLNQFVTQAALEKAEQIMERDRTLMMSQETTAWFFDLLDHPPAPTPHLAASFNRYHANKVDHAGANSIIEG